MKTIQRIYTRRLLTPARNTLRVAAYCRVSTMHDEQLSSLLMQKEYFEAYIREHKDWQFTGIYTDQGTGRNLQKRKAFQQLLLDCRQGKIDLILTKSITRLGRNTVDILECFRELKQLGVDVFFELEKQYLSDPKSELMITVMAAVSQEESWQKSQNIQWGIQRSFEDPNTKYKNRICYGYCHDQNGKLVIDKEQAEIVKMIFILYLDGYSLRGISKELAAKGVKSPCGSQYWCPETLNKILKNEKYTGDVLLQKTFVSSFFSGKQKHNLGEKARYLHHGSHPAIIEKKIYNLVQTLKKW